jgi:hypothetical protein
MPAKRHAVAEPKNNKHDRGRLLHCQLGESACGQTSHRGRCMTGCKLSKSRQAARYQKNRFETKEIVLPRLILLREHNPYLPAARQTPRKQDFDNRMTVFMLLPSPKYNPCLPAIPSSLKRGGSPIPRSRATACHEAREMHRVQAGPRWRPAVIGERCREAHHVAQLHPAAPRRQTSQDAVRLQAAPPLQVICHDRPSTAKKEKNNKNKKQSSKSFATIALALQTDDVLCFRLFFS